MFGFEFLKSPHRSYLRFSCSFKLTNATRHAVQMRVKIVCLPDPASVDSTVITTGPHTGNFVPTLKAPRLRLADLPEELIREIISYLTDYESLQLSRISRAFYATFPPRPRNVTCRTYIKAISLRDCLTRSTIRGSHIVSLEFRCTAFNRINPVTGDPIICDILSQTCNLRSLVCGSLEIGSPKVRNWIQRLPRLSQLQLHRPSKSALNGMVYPQSLSSLHLTQLNGLLSWSDLAKKLSGLTCLTKLVLDRCSLNDPGLRHGVLDIDGVDAPSPLLLVTSLEMLATDLPFDLLYFARMFPNLDTLHLQDSMFPLEDRARPDYYDKSKRVLHKLTYLDSDDGRGSGPIPWEVRHLVVPVLAKDCLYLDAICNTGHLVGLGIRLPAFTANHWNERIERYITNIHILELESFMTVFPRTIQFFVSAFSCVHTFFLSVITRRQGCSRITILKNTGSSLCKSCRSRPLA